MQCRRKNTFCVFPHYLLNGSNFRKKIIDDKFFFSTALVKNISHSKKNSRRYYHKCTLMSMQTTRYSCPILIELKFSRQIFLTILKCQISWKSVQWQSNCSIRTDRHDEANSCFFRNEAGSLKTDLYFFIDAAIISTSDWRHIALDCKTTVNQDQGRCYIQ